MADQDVAKLEAEAIQRVRNRNTGEVVGYVYRWNDGSTQIMWLIGRVGDVEFENLPQREGSESTPDLKPSGPASAKLA